MGRIVPRSTGTVRRMTLWVAAERVETYRMTGLQAGQAMEAEPLRAPGPRSHAYEEGGEKTLCGRALQGLTLFADHAFTHLKQGYRCAECDELVK
jgi:hypothetical protein